MPGMHIIHYRLRGVVGEARIDPPVDKQPMEVIAQINRRLRENDQRGFNGFAVDCLPLGTEKIDPWIPNTGNFRLNMQYGPARPVDIPRLYADRQNLIEEVGRLAEEEGYEFSFLSRLGDEQVKLDWPKKHSLALPLEIAFSENSEKITIPRNKLFITGVWNLTQDYIRTLNEYATAEGCKLRTAVTHNHFDADPPARRFRMQTIEPGEIETVSPEAQIELTWEGDNFDRKAVDMFGNIRGMLLDNHLETASKYCRDLLKYNYGDKPGEIKTDRLPNRSGVYMGYPAAYIHSDIPFRHGEKDLLCTLYYSHFKGRD